MPSKGTAICLSLPISVFYYRKFSKCTADCVSKPLPFLLARKALNSEDWVFLCLPFPLQHYALLWCQSPTIRNNNQHLPILSLFCLYFQIQSRSGNDRPMCWVLQEQVPDWKSNGEPLGSARASTQHPPRIRYQQEIKYTMT